MISKDKSSVFFKTKRLTQKNNQRADIIMLKNQIPFRIKKSLMKSRLFFIAKIKNKKRDAMMYKASIISNFNTLMLT